MDLSNIIREKIKPELTDDIVRIKLEVENSRGFMESAELTNFAKGKFVNVGEGVA